MSVQCPQCGHLNMDESTRCEKCGAAIGASTAAVIASGPVSPSAAGSPTAIADEDVAARMRPRASAPLDDESLSVRRPRPEASSTSGVAWIVVLVVLLVGVPVLLLGGCLFLGGMFAFMGARHEAVVDEKAAVMKVRADVAVDEPRMPMAKMPANPRDFVDGPDRPVANNPQPVLDDRARLDPFIKDNLRPNDQFSALAPSGKIWAALKRDAKTPLQESTLIGGEKGKVKFRETAPDNGLLVGFFLGAEGEYLQAIYLTKAGEQVGNRYGDPKGRVHCIKAKVGYAVGAVEVRSSDVFHGLNVTFLRAGDNALNPADSYQSGPIGKNGGVAFRAGGDGKLIVGVHGKSLDAKLDQLSAGTITSLGLVSLR